MLSSRPRHYWLLCALVLCLFSCGDHPSEQLVNSSLVDTMTKDELIGPNRHLASQPQSSIISFSVIYEGDLNTMLTDKHSAFKYLVETYDLQLDSPAPIDAMNEAYQKITLYAHTDIDDPIEVGKRLSLVEEVLMVQVGEASEDEGLLQ